MSNKPLPTFHVFNFTLDGTGKSTLVISNIEDGSLSWTGDIGNDDVMESLKGAISDMVASENMGPYRTAYGVLESVE